MLLANYEDFENGGLYTNYRRYPYFKLRAELLASRYSGTFLIVGCGWGFLVDELRSLGREAWGCDLSDYAIRCAAREVPESFPYIKKADGTDANALASLGPGRFDVAVSEDVLTILGNEGQMQRMHRAMSRQAGKVVHIVTPEDPDAKQDSRAHWHDIDWWKNTMKGADIISVQDVY